MKNEECSNEVMKFYLQKEIAHGSQLIAHSKNYERNHQNNIQ